MKTSARRQGNWPIPLIRIIFRYTKIVALFRLTETIMSASHHSAVPLTVRSMSSSASLPPRLRFLFPSRIVETISKDHVFDRESRPAV